MAANLDHLSYSSISKYQTCPRAWRFHYLDQVETPTSPNLVFGSAFHQAVEDYLITREMNWATHWEQQLADSPEIAWGKDTPEGMADLGNRMLTQPEIIGVLDGIEPLIVDEQLMIEKRIELRVPGVPIPIIGYIDLVEADGVPADFKTSSRSWNASKAREEMQPSFYLAALNQQGFEGNPDLRFRHYVFVKSKTPKVEIWETQRTLGELFWLFGAIRDVYDAIAARAFPPNPGTWLCNPRYCEYWEICRGG